MIAELLKTKTKLEYVGLGKNNLSNFQDVKKLL